MSVQPDPRQYASPHLASHSLDRVLVVSLLIALAIPGAVFTVTYPTLAVAFGLGLLTARARPGFAGLLVGISERFEGVQSRFAAVTE